MAKNENNQQMNASERDFVFNSKEMSNDELTKELVDSLSKEAKEELFMQSIFQKHETITDSEIKDTVIDKDGTSTFSPLDSSEKSNQPDSELKVEQTESAAGLWQSLTTNIKQIFSETKDDINGIRSNRLFNEDQEERAEHIDGEGLNQEATILEQPVFSEANSQQQVSSQEDISQKQKTAENINEAPDAIDDQFAGFSPEHASLAAEINFDGGTPNAIRGSISTDNSGQVGSGADFNSAKVEVSGLSLNGDAGSKTTVSMWIQADPAGGWEMLTASDRYDLVIQNGNIGFNTARGDLFGSDASELSDGQWHHVVGVFTNGDVSQNMVYIDGIAQEMSQIQGTPSNSSANINSSGGSLFFGSWGANNNYTFSGSMDEVKVFNGPLSPDEVTRLYDIEADNLKWDSGSLSTQEDSVVIIEAAELLANDSDPEGDTLTISKVSYPMESTVQSH